MNGHRRFVLPSTGGVVDIIEDRGEVVAHLSIPGQPPRELTPEETRSLLADVDSLAGDAAIAVEESTKPPLPGPRRL